MLRIPDKHNTIINIHREAAVSHEIEKCLINCAYNMYTSSYESVFHRLPSEYRPLTWQEEDNDHRIDDGEPVNLYVAHG